MIERLHILLSAYEAACCIATAMSARRLITVEQLDARFGYCLYLLSVNDWLLKRADDAAAIMAEFINALGL